MCWSESTSFGKGLIYQRSPWLRFLDADRPGFLRSVRSLVQTSGRAARNVDGEVILYGDDVTEAMEEAMKETRRRREIQLQYNTDNNITPATIQKAIQELIAESETAYETKKSEQPPAVVEDMEPQDIESLITDLTRQMRKSCIGP